MRHRFFYIRLSKVDFEMKARQISGLLILVTSIVWIIWDLYVYIFREENSTISVVITDFSYYSPACPFIIGGLMGHWFFPAKRSVDQ